MRGGRGAALRESRRSPASGGCAGGAGSATSTPTRRRSPPRCGPASNHSPSRRPGGTCGSACTRTVICSRSARTSGGGGSTATTTTGARSGICSTSTAWSTSARACRRCVRTSRSSCAGARFDRDQVLAAMLRIVDTCGLRVGSEAYAEENESYGLTTLAKKHVRVGDRRRAVRLPGEVGKAGAGHAARPRCGAGRRQVARAARQATVHRERRDHRGRRGERPVERRWPAPVSRPRTSAPGTARASRSRHCASTCRRPTPPSSASSTPSTRRRTSSTTPAPSRGRTTSTRTCSRHTPTGTFEEILRVEAAGTRAVARSGRAGARVLPRRPARAPRTGAMSRGQIPRLHQLFRDRAQLDVAALRDVHHQVEGLRRGDAVALHEDPHRLTDDLAAVHRLAEVASPCRSPTARARHASRSRVPGSPSPGRRRSGSLEYRFSAPSTSRVVASRQANMLRRPSWAAPSAKSGHRSSVRMSSMRTTSASRRAVTQGPRPVAPATGRRPWRAARPRPGVSTRLSRCSEMPACSQPGTMSIASSSARCRASSSVGASAMPTAKSASICTASAAEIILLSTTAASSVLRVGRSNLPLWVSDGA